MLRSLFRSIKEDYRWDYVPFFALGLISFSWFQGNHFISADTFVWAPDFVRYFISTLFTWDTSYATGFSAVRAAGLFFPYAFYGALLQVALRLGTSLLYEKLLFYVCFSFSGASAYFLLRTLRLGRLPSLFGGLFYMFNLFASVVVWYLSIGLFFPFYAFFPLMVAFYIRSLRGEMNLVLANCLIALTPAVSSFANPVFFAMYGGVLVAYTFFAIGDSILRRDLVGVRGLVRRSLGFGVVLVVLNLFWILPLVSDLQHQYEGASNESIGLSGDLETLKLNSVRVRDALRLKGLWSFKGHFMGDLYYPWVLRFELPLVSLLLYLITLVVLMGGWAVLKLRRRVELIWVVLLVSFVFLVSGLKTSWSPILVWFYAKFPFLARAFRGGFTKYGFVLALAYTILFAFGAHLLTRSRKLVFSLFAIGALLILSSPFLRGEVIYQGGEFSKSFLVKFPEDYAAFQGWDGEGPFQLGRHLSLPLAKTNSFISNWRNGYQGGDYLRYFSRQAVLASNFNLPTGALGDSINQGKAVLADRLAGMLNVWHFILREDAGWQLPFSFLNRDKSQLLEFMSAYPLERDLGSLKVYRTDQSVFLPRVFVPERVVFSQGGAEWLPDLLTLAEFPVRTGFYFFGEGLPREELSSRYGVEFVEGVRHGLPFDLDVIQWGKSWHWPEANVAPSSFFHPLVVWKEDLAERRARDNFSKRVDLLLWHGVKRVQEINEFAMRESDSAVLRLAEAFSKRAYQATTLLKEVPAERRDEAFWDSCLRTLGYLRRVSSLSSRFGKEAQVVLTSPEEDFEAWLLDLGADLCEEGYVCYRPNLVDGDHYIAYGESLAGLSVISKDGSENALAGASVPSAKGLWWLGKFEWHSGLEKLRGEEVVSQNLVSGQAWEEATLLLPVREAELKLRITPGPHYLKDTVSSRALPGLKGGTVYRLSFEYRLIEGMGLYIGVFEDGYREMEKVGGQWVEGRSPETREVWSQELSAADTLYFFQVGEEAWGYFTDVFETNFDSEGGEVFVGAFYEGESSNIVSGLIRNLRVEEVVEPRLLLRNTTAGGEGVAVVPGIAFARINPTKYKVKVSGATEPYHLILNESFHEGWEVYLKDSRFTVQDSKDFNIYSPFSILHFLLTRITDIFLDNGDYGEEAASYFDGDIKEMTHRNTFLEPATFETWGRQPLDAEHLEVNGYANSWYIEPEHVANQTDYELVIEFGPQRWFYIGLGISMLTLVGSVVYLGVKARSDLRSKKGLRS